MEINVNLMALVGELVLFLRSHRMKRMIHIISTLIVLMMLVLNFSFTSNAYSEEEKQQAKAWLSAHGYSPDMGGASQAYQDYLNGKFDEELGVDINGDGIPSAVQTTTEASGDATSEELTEDKTTTETPEEEGEASDDADDSNKEVSKSDKAFSNQTIEASNEEEHLLFENTESLLDGIVKSDKEAVIKESTLYQPDRSDQYQEAGIVIVLSAVLMLLVGLWLK